MRVCASKKTLFALEQARADVARRRQRWRSFQGNLDPRRLVFIDETWIKTNMAPLRGWGAKGKRLRGFAPHGHWRTLTFLGALRCDGLAAPCVFDGPINGQCFRACVEQQLLPPYSPGLNPIEQAFAKIKHWMRAAQKRSIDDTWRHIGTLVSTIEPKECANYFQNAGYASVKT